MCQWHRRRGVRLVVGAAVPSALTGGAVVAESRHVSAGCGVAASRHSFRTCGLGRGLGGRSVFDSRLCSVRVVYDRERHPFETTPLRQPADLPLVITPSASFTDWLSAGADRWSVPPPNHPLIGPRSGTNPILSSPDTSRSMERQPLNSADLFVSSPGLESSRNGTPIRQPRRSSRACARS